MPPLPILLILTSCFTHAAWNLMARHSRQEVAFMGRMLVTMAPLSLAAIAVASAFVPSFPLKAFLLVLPSGLICGGYFLFLALAYHSSDFTVVYPVARALPVLMVAALDLIFRDRAPTAIGWAGMALVMAGCMLAPQESFRAFALRHYSSKTFGWIFLTAATIVAFTMLDKLAAETVRPGLASAVIQTGLFHIFAAAGYLCLRPLLARGKGLAEGLGWRWPAVAGATGFFTYTLVLWAFQMSEKTGYLLAFRQFSIVVGVAAAFALHRERGAAVRVPATLAIVAGLVLVSLLG